MTGVEIVSFLNLGYRDSKVLQLPSQTLKWECMFDGDFFRIFGFPGSFCGTLYLCRSFLPIQMNRMFKYSLRYADSAGL